VGVREKRTGLLSPPKKKITSKFLPREGKTHYQEGPLRATPAVGQVASEGRRNRTRGGTAHSTQAKRRGVFKKEGGVGARSDPTKKNQKASRKKSGPKGRDLFSDEEPEGGGRSKGGIGGPYWGRCSGCSSHVSRVSARTEKLKGIGGRRGGGKPRREREKKSLNARAKKKNLVAFSPSTKRGACKFLLQLQLNEKKPRGAGGKGGVRRGPPRGKDVRKGDRSKKKKEKSE